MLQAGGEHSRRQQQSWKCFSLFMCFRALTTDRLHCCPAPCLQGTLSRVRILDEQLRQCRSELDAANQKVCPFNNDYQSPLVSLNLTKILRHGFSMSAC